MRAAASSAGGGDAVALHAVRRAAAVYVQNSSLEIAWRRVLVGERPTIAGRPRRAVLHERDRGLLDRLPRRLAARRADGGADARGRPARQSASAATEAATFAVDAPLRLRYVPLRRARADPRARRDPVERAAAFADACRINALYMIMDAPARATSGRLQLTRHRELAAPRGARATAIAISPRRATTPRRSTPARSRSARSTSRSCHRCAASAACRAIPTSQRRRRSSTNTGSLGMGISKAHGFVLADRLAGRTADASSC